MKGRPKGSVQTAIGLRKDQIQRKSSKQKPTSTHKGTIDFISNEDTGDEDLNSDTDTNEELRCDQCNHISATEGLLALH